MIPEIEKLPVSNKDSCMERLGDDEELYQELVELYFNDAPNIINELKKELQQDNLPVVERHAHSLKSASANVGAERVSAVAFRIESIAREGAAEGLAVLFAYLVAQFEVFKNSRK